MRIVAGAFLVVLGALESQASPPESPAGTGGARAVEVVHNPPLLLLPGEALDLSFEVICPAMAGIACRPGGKVMLRPAGAPAFEKAPLHASSGRALRASVPAERLLSAGALEYLAMISDAATGRSATLPSAGTRAPQKAWVLRDPVTVVLPTLALGATAVPDEVRLRATWGSRDGQAGLDAGDEQSTIGPSSFDVAGDGTVVLLDQVNRRMVRQGFRASAAAPLPGISGCFGDLAVGSDGAVHVLESLGRHPVLRSFAPDGRALAVTPLAERTSDMVRIAGGDVFVHQYPSDQWMLVRRDGVALSREDQSASGRAGRALPGARSELVVKATPREVRAALVAGDRVERSWRVVPADRTVELGEVQLAELRGEDLLLVVRTWREIAATSADEVIQEAEFLALRVYPDGGFRRISIETAEWAECSPVSRFRLGPDGLYQLRSSPAGVEVGLFEIGR